MDPGRAEKGNRDVDLSDRLSLRHEPTRLQRGAMQETTSGAIGVMAAGLLQWTRLPVENLALVVPAMAAQVVDVER